VAKHAAPLSIFSWAFLALGLIMFALAGVGWSQHVSNEGAVVANNVSYAGEPMEGVNPAGVESVVADRSAEILDRLVMIDYGQGELAVPLGTIGFSYDQPTTAAAVLAAGGLGLTLAAAIIDLHRGRITAERRSPRGLRIRIELPGSAPVAPRSDSHRPQAQEDHPER